jgi:hypothetical protein
VGSATPSTADAAAVAAAKQSPALPGQANDEGAELMDALRLRTPRVRTESGLNLPRKSRKRKKRDRAEESSDAESDSPGFRIASLPEGVERLKQIHERKPGALANLTLQRYREILDRSTGSEANLSSQQMLPPVARAYLSRVYFITHHPLAVGTRTAREMKTLMTIVDLICQNDGLRALDVALQRQKSLELQFHQGNWEQAQQLELIPLDEDRSYFKQELKAAQQEVQSVRKLEAPVWRPSRAREEWWPRGGGGAQGGEARAEAGLAGDGDAAPLNHNDQSDGYGQGRSRGWKGGKGKKGFGKGKPKGKRQW